ncbi:MAG: hypothetical protein GY810_15185 [Aureispira sp.]|nr:hypothetical protein [Aureispira sp.]
MNKFFLLIISIIAAGLVISCDAEMPANNSNNNSTANSTDTTAIDSSGLLAAQKQKVDVSTKVFPNNQEGAWKIAEALNKDDDYSHKLYKSLFPNEEDLSYVVMGEEATIMLNEYTYPTYRRGLYMQGQEGETRILVFELTSQKIKDGDFGLFSEDYARLADVVKEDLTFYAFEFVKEGAETGSRFETLVCVNDKWIFTPHPHKAFQ